MQNKKTKRNVDTFRTINELFRHIKQSNKKTLITKFQRGYYK